MVDRQSLPERVESIFPPGCDVVIAERMGWCVHRKWRLGTRGDAISSYEAIICSECESGFEPIDVWCRLAGKAPKEHNFFTWRDIDGEEIDTKAMPDNALMIYAPRYSEQFVLEGRFIGQLERAGYMASF